MKFYGFCKDSKCGAEVVPAENFKVFTGATNMKNGAGGVTIELEDGDYYVLAVGLRIPAWNATNEYRFTNYEPEAVPTVRVTRKELAISLKDTNDAVKLTLTVNYKVVLFKAD